MCAPKSSSLRTHIGLHVKVIYLVLNEAEALALVVVIVGIGANGICG